MKNVYYKSMISQYFKTQKQLEDGLEDVKRKTESKSAQSVVQSVLKGVF